MRIIDWDIKAKGLEDLDRARTLATDLKAAENLILEFVPPKTDKRKLKRCRVRIYPFSRRESANELFLVQDRHKYVCLNSSLLKKRYWAALQHLIHGLAHSFCHLRDGIAEEVFCEWVGYSVVEQLAKDKGEQFARRVLKSVMASSHPSYRIYYRAARRLNDKESGRIIKLNNKAKKRRISKKKEKKIISRALKARRVGFEELEDYKVELEKGFRKVR